MQYKFHLINDNGDKAVKAKTGLNMCWFRVKVLTMLSVKPGFSQNGMWIFRVLRRHRCSFAATIKFRHC